MTETEELVDVLESAGTDGVLLQRVCEQPHEAVALLQSLDQILFAARLGGEVMRALGVSGREEADAALEFMLAQIDEAADQLRAFAPRDSYP